MTQLTLVPTPIGNLDDITLRALTCLREVEAIAAEDTRHSGKLLTHFGIRKPLERLDAHTMKERAPRVLERYNSLAYITDAGSPGISDPGVELVSIALARGDDVLVLPGATAFVPALVLSGLPLGRFTFEGFLPRTGRTRRERLEAICRAPVTTAMYESPTRLLATLKDLANICGPERPASVSREISKRFETTYRGSLASLVDTFQTKAVKGECVIVLAPAETSDADTSSSTNLDIHEQARALAAQGLRTRDIRSALVALGVARNDAYALALDVTTLDVTTEDVPTKDDVPKTDVASRDISTNKDTLTKDVTTE
jgi:16S rRNA (cytidine1402-2'-O)-methyltransferase